MAVLRLLWMTGLIWCGLLASSIAQQADEERSPVRIQVQAPEQVLYPGQWTTVSLQLEIDADFREESMLQLFRRSLEVPLDVQTTAWADVQGLEWQPLAELSTANGQSLAWDGQQVSLDWALQNRDGRSVWVAQTERAVRALHAGSYSLPAARVRYATATRFELDILGDRIPVDEQRVEVHAKPIEWQVSAFPLEGQPSAFRGALGEWRVEVEKQIAHTDAQGDLRLVYRLRPAQAQESPGSVLPQDWRPSLEMNENWQVLGILQLPAQAGESRLQIDLRARRSGELWSPTWSVVSFLAEQPAYVQIELPRWRISASSALTKPVAAPDSVSYSPATQTKTTVRIPPGFGLGVGLGAVLLALGAVLHQAMRQRVRDGVADAGALVDAPKAVSAEQEFIEWLAQHLDWQSARLIQPRLTDALTAHGISEELARHTAEWLREVEAARYGGPPLADAPARLQALSEAWSRDIL